MTQENKGVKWMKSSKQINLFGKNVTKTRNPETLLVGHKENLLE
jgi:hypothetical protein